MKVLLLPSSRVYPDLSKVRLLFGVHCDEEPPLGPVISWVTRQVMPPPYVLPAGPATHAFVCLDYAGVRWRLDGKPPVAAWAPWSAYADESLVALWEVIPEAVGEAALRRGIDRASVSHGVLYNVPLLVAQLLALVPESVAIPPAIAALTRRVPPPPALPRLPGLPPLADLLPDPGKAEICTTLDMDVIRVMGPPLVGHIDGMQDRFPERFGRVLEVAVRAGLVRRRRDVNAV